jgi:hypothetical protein
MEGSRLVCPDSGELNRNVISGTKSYRILPLLLSPESEVARNGERKTRGKKRQKPKKRETKGKTKARKEVDVTRAIATHSPVKKFRGLKDAFSTFVVALGKSGRRDGEK